MKRTSQMEQAKQEYEGIEIPEELSAKVKEIMEHHGNKKGTVIFMRRKVLQRTAACAAAAVLVFAVSVNTSTAFAKTMDGVPVLGSLARIFTFRSYSDEKENIRLTVEVPSLEFIAEANGGTTEAVNQEIHALCEAYAQEAVTRAEEYRQAFLDTGGTEEEWEAHKIAIQVGYEVKSQTERYLSFMVWGNENWSSAFDTVRYYTVDLESKSLASLEDILGKDYETVVNQSIRAQMKEREAQGMTFFTEEQGGFAGITEADSFYLNEQGNPVIVFEKYEIGPGAYGAVEFEIKKQGNGLKEEAADMEAGKAALEERYYEDNFAVEQEAYAAFALRIQQTVGERNVEALAEMACYPFYVGKQDGSIRVNSKEELLALGEDVLFPAELSEAIKEAGIDDLSPSRAGFALPAQGKPNIVFGVKDGRLGVTGLNY